MSAALLALAPSRQRASRADRRLRTQPLPWLKPAAREPLIDTLVEVEARQPLSFRESVRMVPDRRTQALMSRNRRVLAARHGVEVSSPLLDARVVHALAEDGGILGRGDRTAVLRSFVADLLPDAVLARVGKATFGEAYMGSGTRNFAANWTGDGVDPRLVNPDELRRIWLSDEGNALTAALVQAAWLAGRGATARPSARSS